MCRHSINVYNNLRDYFTHKYPNLYSGASFGNESLEVNRVYLFYVSGLQCPLCAWQHRHAHCHHSTCAHTHTHTHTLSKLKGIVHPKILIPLCRWKGGWRVWVHKTLAHPWARVHAVCAYKSECGSRGGYQRAFLQETRCKWCRFKLNLNVGFTDTWMTPQQQCGGIFMFLFKRLTP